MIRSGDGVKRRNVDMGKKRAKKSGKKIFKVQLDKLEENEQFKENLQSKILVKS